MSGKSISMLLAVALALTGCATGTDAPGQSATESAAVVYPDTPVGERMQWLQQVLEAAADADPNQLAPEFSEEFLAQVPAEQLATLLNERIRPAAPFTVTDYSGNDLAASAVFTGTVGDPFTVQLAVSASGEITTLLFTPVYEHEPAHSLDEVRQRLEELPVEADLLVRVADDDVLLPAHNAAPIGSVFKLWVLKALAQAINAGQISWEDELTVTEEVKSLPSGKLQDEPDGTKVTVLEAAQLMIEISDNTATDLLMAAVGRDRVNAAAPESMRPVATTKETFEQLGITSADDINPEDSLAGRGTWSATAEQVAMVFDELAALATSNPEIDDILSANPGVAVTGYDSLWFKGGSLPGVLAGSWRGILPDGREVTMVLRITDDSGTAVAEATAEATALAGDALRLCAE